MNGPQYVGTGHITGSPAKDSAGSPLAPASVDSKIYDAASAGSADSPPIKRNFDFGETAEKTCIGPRSSCPS
jgi:hypothetical protein